MDVKISEKSNSIEKLREEENKILELWEEAKRYGWKLDNGAPLWSEPHVMIYTIRAPSKDDARNNWDAIWRNIPVYENNKRYYIKFPHWFEEEVAKERPFLLKAKNFTDRLEDDITWLWDLAWSRYASTGEGFN
jgi:hypothetical protein